MRIKQVKVKKLFGIFDHDIPLKMDERITIIHGPNGFGKTVLLAMLNAFFSSRYHELRRIPFTELEIHFDNRSNLKLHKTIKPSSNGEIREAEKNELIFEYRIGRSKPKVYKMTPRTSQNIQIPLGIIEHEISDLERIGPETWIYFPTQEKLSLDDIVERFGERLPFPTEKIPSEPDWLKNIKTNLPIRFIETQRLLTFTYPRRRRDYEGRPPMIPAVMNYSDELASSIQTILAGYATLSQSLDRTFPTRLVRGSSAPDLTVDELRRNLTELEEKRSRLMAAGLLEKEEGIDVRELQKITETNRNVLSVYIDDVKKKLGVFDELTNKIDLFVKIINSRFLYKQMTISKKEGFVFKTFDGKNVAPTMLSSGEQHELVLLYELLFKVKPDSLILIDEPELSLHVVWQQQFLKDLQEITRLARFDVLLATHSPQIIHDRWDLAVELGGPENETLSDRP